jgi:hypothetical protein
MGKHDVLTKGFREVGQGSHSFGRTWAASAFMARLSYDFTAPALTPNSAAICASVRSIT